LRPNAANDAVGGLASPGGGSLPPRQSLEKRLDMRELGSVRAGGILTRNET
jgi:hypothetical protein